MSSPSPTKARLIADELRALAVSCEALAQLGEAAVLERAKRAREIAARLELLAEHVRPASPGFMGLIGGGR